MDALLRSLVPWTIGLIILMVVFIALGVIYKAWRNQRDEKLAKSISSERTRITRIIAEAVRKRREEKEK